MADNQPDSTKAPDSPDVIATRKQNIPTQPAPPSPYKMFQQAPMVPPLSTQDSLKPDWTPKKP